MNGAILICNLDKLHTTALGKARILKNINMEIEDVVGWCQNKIQEENSVISRKGKNWYIEIDKYRITVNAYSYTIITVHHL